jgi:nitrite reductase (NADH) small subunit
MPGGIVEDVPKGGSKSIWVKSHKVAVFNLGGQLTACKDRCPHMGALLSEGRISGQTVACTWHGWTFEMPSGRCVNKDWAGVETYAVRIVGDRYEVEVPID